MNPFFQSYPYFCSFAIQSENEIMTKDRFIQLLREAVTDFAPAISCADGSWAVKGFIDIHKTIYTISTDNKALSPKRTNKVRLPEKQYPQNLVSLHPRKPFGLFVRSILTV